MHSVTSNAVATECLKISDIVAVHDILTTDNGSLAILSKSGGWILDIWTLNDSNYVMQGRSGNQNWIRVEKWNGTPKPNTQIEVYYLWCNVSF